MSNLIRVKAKWDYNPKKVFPLELNLWTRCPDCEKTVDVLKYFCYYIPNLPKNIIGNSMEMTVRCPECDFKFMLVKLEYNNN